MKQIKIFILIAVIFIVGGCTESYIEGYDVSPNNPSVVLNSNMLTASQVALIGNVTGELARMTSIWVQSQSGISNQSLEDQATYMALEGDNVNDWGSIYQDWMESANNLANQAGDENSHYKGMGLIMKAWAAAFASDFWGDVPFSEATAGIENFNPHFDPQEEVYSQVQSMLSQGIVLLSKSEGGEVVGTDDLFFGGNAENWIKMAWTLKARYFNRVSKKYAWSADSVLYCLSKGFDSSEDDAFAKFGKNANNANQWYAFYSTQRIGYMAMGEYIVNNMVERTVGGEVVPQDPRLPFYAAKDKNEEYTGSPADTRNINLDASTIGPLYNKTDAPVPLITYAEAKFLEAEAKLRKNDADGAAMAYNEGVKVSVKWVTGVEAPDEFVAKEASMSASDIDLQTIIDGKYITLFTQTEVWNDWVRTGYPTLVANPDSRASSGGIPLRLPTCIDERLYNTNATVVSDVYKAPWYAE